MKRMLYAIPLLLVTGLAMATGVSTSDRNVQASMLVSGDIEVAPDGSVMQYALDHPAELPSQVKGMLAKAIPTWKFQPVIADGKPAIAKAAMSVRVVAKPVDKENFRISVESAHFGHQEGDPAIKSMRKQQPVYPRSAINDRVSGVVYVIARVDASGKVADVAAQQVNLHNSGSAVQLERWRAELARASVDAIRNWTFTPAASDAAPGRLVRMPVTFILHSGIDSSEPSYGQWDVYVPGPVQLIPWLGNKLFSAGVDAVSDGAIDQVGQGLQLLTPLTGA